MEFEKIEFICINIGSSSRKKVEKVAEHRG